MGAPRSEEAVFWALIEEAWKPRGKAVNAVRRSFATRDPDDEIELEPIEGALEAVLADFRRGLEKLGQAELAAMDRVLERKLYELDREEIQEFTDGSDDGFLYCRGFIVLLGRAFYDAVNASPELAVLDAECEEVCYLAAHVYEERFGAFPDHQSGISRETGSNKEGWGR